MLSLLLTNIFRYFNATRTVILVREKMTSAVNDEDWKSIGEFLK